MRPYEEVIEDWVREYVYTMDEGILRPGDQSGDEPLGVKIIFDGYGALETDDEYIENGNKNMESYAIFIHKDAAHPDFMFPQHEFTPWGLVHRPDEEVCIYAWYDVENDEWTINSLYETSDHKMTDQEVMVILEALYEHYYKPWENADFSINEETGMPNWPFGDKKDKE